MKRAAVVAAGLLAIAPRPARAAETYELVTPTGTISGTLTMPSARAPVRVVLIIAGSGGVDRDGNAGTAERTDAYRLLADALAAAGIASLRYDKRGVGLSAAALGDLSKLRFEDYVADAGGWLRKLAADRRFASVGVAGHSEGSLIGMLAAQRAPSASFVSLAGPGFPAAELLHRQLAAQLGQQPALASASDRILGALAKGETSEPVPPQLLPLYSPAIQNYLISWFRYDPRAEIAKLNVPCTIVQGDNDLQVTVDDARALANAQPRAKLVVLTQMTHVLKDSTARTLAEQLETVYLDPNVPIDDGVVQAISATV